MLGIKSEYNPITGEFAKKLSNIIEETEKRPDFIRYDFQGWPVFKKTLRELLIELGAQEFEMEGKNVFGFLAGEPILDVYPETLEDDGMAYGINEMCFSDANISEDKDGNQKVYFWRNKKYEKIDE